MDAISRVLTLVEDLIELPKFLEIKRSLQSAGAGAFRTMGYVCRDQAEKIPDRIALRFETEQVSFGEFNLGVNRYANLLRARGVGKGDVVNLMMENSPALLMAQGACAKLGAIGALINHHLEGEALAHVHRVSGARIALVDRPSARAMLPLLAQLPGLEVHADVPDLVAEGSRFRPLQEELADASTGEPEIPDVKVADVFLYVYTSGTTGFPKPAIVRHMRFTAGGHSLAILLGEKPEDCAYAPTPLYHGYANFVGFAPAFHTGACFASRRKFSASEFLDDVRRHRVTIFAYVGELCRYLMRQPPTPRDRDHSIRLATGPGLRPDIWEAFRDRFGIARIIDSYGQTEGNVSLQNRRGRVGSCGRCAPFTHGQLKLARYDHEAGDLVRGPDGFLIECGVGEAGELLSRISKDSPMAFDGYADARDNERKLRRDCFEKGDVYLRTGDLLRRDYASYYYFVDRIGDTFRWKGENVSTQEVQELLTSYPGIHMINVFGVQVPGAEGRAGMAVLLMEDQAKFDPVTFYRHTQEHLPVYARPAFVRLVKDMYLTSTFKLRKVELHKAGFDPNAAEGPVYYRDEAKGAYLPLTQEVYERIKAGQVRF